MGEPVLSRSSRWVAGLLSLTLWLSAILWDLQPCLGASAARRVWGKRGTQVVGADGEQKALAAA